MGRLARISPINDATFVSSTEAETVTLYSATTSYASGTQVRDDVTHRIYESITGGATGTVTIDAATDVITWVNHTLIAGDKVMFTTTGSMAGIVANTVYYVVNPTGNTFQIANVLNGAVRDLTGSNTGTHTATKNPNYGNAVTDTDHWLLIGPTNRWAAYDDSSATKTTATGTLTHVVAPDRFDTVAMLSMENVAAVMMRLATTVASRTNLLTRSEEFNQAAWTKTNAPVTANAGVSPYNTTTADQIADNGTNGEHYASQSLGSISAGATVKISIFAKADASSWLAISSDSTGAGGVSTTYFDLANGAVGTVGLLHTPTIQPLTYGAMAGQGWYRCIISVPQVTTSTFGVRFGLAQADGVKSYAGGTGGLLLWGAQAVNETTLTGYIPTAGTTAASTASVYFEWNYDLADTSFNDSWYTENGIYSETRYKPDLWVNDLPPFASSTLTITYTGSGTIKVGNQVHGLSREIGGVQYGANFGIVNYSTLTRDDYGNAANVIRGYNRKGEMRLWIEADKVDAVINLLAEYRASAVLWDMTDQYSSSRIHGYLKDFSLEIAYPSHSVYTLSIDGLP